MNSEKELAKIEDREDQVDVPQGHPAYSGYRRRNFASINPVAQEASYPITMWLSVIGFVIILALIFGGVSLITGCDDTPTPSDMVVADADTYTTEVVGGDTVDMSNETDATDTNGADVVEEIEVVVVPPCKGYEWLNNDFWCCPGSGQCEWRECSIEEVDGQCLVFCEKTLNHKPVDYPQVTFSPPNSFSVFVSGGDSLTTCNL